MTKKQLIRKLLEAFKQYALVANAWAPDKEVDYDEFEETIEELIYSHVEEVKN